MVCSETSFVGFENNPIKKNNNSTQVIEMLGQKTLSDTMNNINNFIYNDV